MPKSQPIMLRLFSPIPRDLQRSSNSFDNVIISTNFRQTGGNSEQDVKIQAQCMWVFCKGLGC